MEIRIEGERELVKSLRAIDRGLVKEINVIHREVAEPVAEQARGRAPSLSGRLSGSIRAQGTQRVARVAAGSKSIPYAGPIHFGWPGHNIEPQPFLTDALSSEADRIPDHYDRLLSEFLDRVWSSI